MSKQSRLLQVGDKVTTDYCYIGWGRQVPIYTIVARKIGASSQSGIVFKVEPRVPRSGGDVWMDADWFEPVAKGAK